MSEVAVVEEREPEKTRGSFLFLLAERQESLMVKGSTNTGGLPYKVLYRGALLQGPSPHLSAYHSHRKKKGIPVIYLQLKKGTPFTFKTGPFQVVPNK